MTLFQVFESVLKGSQNEAKLLLHHLKLQPNIIKWNNIGEMVFHGEVIDGSNITDLMLESVTNQKQSNIPTMFKSIFLKALAEANVPSRWIKNKKQNGLLQSYRDIQSRNTFGTPDVKKVKLDKWLSST